ncbi:type I deoxyribonuclease HsdR [Dissulfurispira thermophila]|uniref:Type I restriction enzyme endonuclease subunit n=1 Tax=Dissulfurispira thermophila TaxID=2715679 RepID=A0A7G1H161_9BACT|nr:HsdR family type I site-specific deoxyribonuclease [Dissulfurispira thermophila]BCB95417.1 type I deoxyribonuclease HsdR [Dissulfurispira thermophila]
MSTPTEHKTVQSRILQYAQEIGWKYVSQAEAEKRRGFNNDSYNIQQRCRTASLYFEDLLFTKVKEFNPKYTENQSSLIKTFTSLKPDIYGNRDFLKYLRNEGTYYCKEENRDLNLILIDYDNLGNNVFEITEEFYWYNGRYGNREDIVFLINGIPVLVVECKNPTVSVQNIESISVAIDQIRRYHSETPEFFVPEQIFTATEAISFYYGVTWNTVRRNIFNWKSDETGNLENKVKTFCSISQVMAFIKNFILFAEKDEELNKFILRQHQVQAVEKIMERSHDPVKKRGLIWHTQGSGKTYTMIKAAEMLFKAPKLEKPTILLLIDRNELEDQMIKNLRSLGINNVEHAYTIARLNELLRNDYRGIIVTMIHKFRDMLANINTRNNIFILIDEAHRTTGGDLGNYLMAGLPNATYIGFTGTPVDKTAYGKGTFKTFGMDDEKGYLHKYSISESITDGTTLPLYYNLAPNEMRVPYEQLDKEFLSLAEAQGISDIEELNKILDKAVNLKNFLKSKDRINKIARFVAEHYTQNVEPLWYKAFLVAVDREACAYYKKALDNYLPPEYSVIVYTGNNNDSALLKEFHLDEKKERQIRKAFTQYGEFPKILIVTEKLLTGFDAPILYAMYLDKPMRDHTLLQTIARVNRPYENEALEMVKPHGFVLDFIGIFEKLEKALSFDSDEVNAVVKDLDLLKNSFKSKMESKVPEYLKLIQHDFNDKDVDNLIEYFRDKEKRKEFFKEYKECEMLYEIISPDAFLRPYIDNYRAFSAMYQIMRNAYSKKIYIDTEFMKKTESLVKENVWVYGLTPVNEIIEINEKTIDLIKQKEGGDNTKVINLIKSIEKTAEEQSRDPFLIAMAERAKQIQEHYESRQLATSEALQELLNEIKNNEDRKKEQDNLKLDNLTYYLFKELESVIFSSSKKSFAATEFIGIAKKIKNILEENAGWYSSEKAMREARQKVTIELYKSIDDPDKVTALVEHIFSILSQSRQKQ